MILPSLDENVSLDDDGDDFDVGRNKGNRIEDVDGSDGVEEEDDQRHLRMLQGITGMSSDAFEGKKKKKNVVISEVHPESEYNPTRDVLKGDGHITVQDLSDPIQGKPRYSKLRKRVQHMDRKSTSIQAPLPKADREKLERMAVEDVDLRFSTVGAIASEFEPRTELEKKIASLVYGDKVMESHKEDGSKLIEMNKDKGTRAAMAEQLHHHAFLKRKINTVKDSSSSSSDSCSGEDDEGSNQDRAFEILEKVKKKTLKVLQDNEEVPNSRVLSLPFMVHGMKKRREVAIEEAKLALQEYEHLEGTDDAVNLKSATASGRRVFGMTNNEAPKSNNKIKTDNNKMKTDNYYGNSDSEDDMASDFLNFDDIARDPGLKTTYEVAIFASDSWRKVVLCYQFFF
ncbi:hypothetical protein CRYUN_Cryun20dG0061400 [Craigia yunnanensis]